MSTLKIKVLNQIHEIVLDRECWGCKGVISRSEDPCNMCDNSGYILTEDGEELLDFINKHSR